jgi:hypothetical protein
VNLLEWSEQLPDWQRDALRRIAISGHLSDPEKTAILARLKRAHGIVFGGDHECVALGASDLPADAGGTNPTILVGIGPVRHVDQLATDQELQFALRGITLVYGDNGSGKSGYARIAKKLCHARWWTIFAATSLPQNPSLLPKCAFVTNPIRRERRKHKIGATTATRGVIAGHGAR